eukprot:12854215-Alexandrium_andersonii.AAC.1
MSFKAPFKRHSSVQLGTQCSGQNPVVAPCDRKDPARRSCDTARWIVFFISGLNISLHVALNCLIELCASVE